MISEISCLTVGLTSTKHKTRRAGRRGGARNERCEVVTHLYPSSIQRQKQKTIANNPQQHRQRLAVVGSHINSSRGLTPLLRLPRRDRSHNASATPSPPRPCTASTNPTIVVFFVCMCKVNIREWRENNIKSITGASLFFSRGWFSGEAIDDIGKLSWRCS